MKHFFFLLIIFNIKYILLNSFFKSVEIIIILLYVILVQCEYNIIIRKIKPS